MATPIPLTPDRVSGRTRARDRNAALGDLALRLVDSNAVGLFQIDTGWRVAYGNDLFNLLNDDKGPAGRLNIPQLKSLSERALHANQSFTRPLSLEVDGQKRHYWAKVIPILDHAGMVMGLAGAFQDWTAHFGQLNMATLDQARFRDFARASSDWFWETDVEQRLTALSDRVTALTGLPASGYIGQALERLGRCAPNLAGEMPLARALRDHAPFRNQLFIIEGSGEPALFHLSGVPLFDGDGAFRGYRGAGMDVTRLYRMEEEARASRQRLESALDELKQKNGALDLASARAQAALQTKNEFLAAISHELRTPLNAIIGFAESMSLKLFGDLSPAYADYARDILSAGQHLLGLINDVLDVSVIESGELSLSIDNHAVARLIEQSCSLIALRARGKGLTLTQTGLDQGFVVRIDERRTLQIFVNLLTNAVKFTPSGGRIGIDVARAPDVAQRIAITVWDNGPGIDRDDQENVFAKYHQLPGDVAQPEPDGTGLGLHISRELARMMGGDIRLDSCLGEGARFTVLLPEAT